MQYDAFIGGVEPGGLRNKNEIRILLCYLVNSIGTPLSKDDILSIMQENGFANYFEVTNALAELTANGNLKVSNDPPVYHAVAQTKLIADQLDKVLPLSVREKAIAAAVNLLAKTRREQENKVSIQQTNKGYNVNCHISGGDLELMNISLYVPDEHQAKLVRKVFHKSPETVYQVLLALLTDNPDLAKKAFEEMSSSSNEK